MKHSLALVLVLVSAFVLGSSDDADARRIGGGRSFGAQRSITPSPSVTAPSTGIAQNPVMPAPPGVAARPGVAGAAAGAATGAVASRGASRWLGPIAGIAAGLGLAALFSHFGLAEGLGNILLIVLVIGAGLFLVRALMARRNASSAGPVPFPAGRPSLSESAPAAFQPAWGGATAAAAAAPAARRYPPDFEPAPFIAEAKRQFIRLQQAYDEGDRKLLADILTPEMEADIGRELAERGTHVPTEVVSINGDVLEVTTEGDKHWASIRFTGLTREDGKAQPEAFDEVWNLVKPVDGATGWRLAGIQQYA